MDFILYQFFLYLASILIIKNRQQKLTLNAQLLLYLLNNSNFIMTPEAEKFNGWAAMLGLVAAFGAYATTGQIIPGIF